MVARIKRRHTWRNWGSLSTNENDDHAEPPGFIHGEHQDLITYKAHIDNGENTEITITSRAKDKKQARENIKNMIDGININQLLLEKEVPL